MKPADYTLPFYQKCLSQHIWPWRERCKTQTIIDFHMTNETRLLQVALELGGEFIEAFNQHSPTPIFPFAGIPATETTPTTTPNTNTPMKLEINIPDELFHPLVQAIDRLTAAMTAGGFTSPLGDTNSTSATTDGPTTVVEVAPETEKPKAVRLKKEKAPTPEPVVVETRPDTELTREEDAETDKEHAKEIAEEAPAKVKVPTGPELSEKVKPLAAHPELQQDLIRYKSNELKINGPIRLVTDETALALFDAKVIELLAKIPVEV